MDLNEMDFDKSYIQILSQKYRLAVAIAVLKEKPEHLSAEEYIQLLKNRLKNDSDDDLDLTVGSDDFDLENNDNTPDVHNDDTNGELNDVSNNNEAINIDNDRFCNENDDTFNAIVADNNGAYESNNEIHDRFEKNDGIVEVNNNETNCSHDSVNILEDLNRDLIFDGMGSSKKGLDDVNRNVNNIAIEHNYTTQNKELHKASLQNAVELVPTTSKTVINMEIETLSNMNENQRLVEVSTDRVNEIMMDEALITRSNVNCNDIGDSNHTFYDSQRPKVVCNDDSNVGADNETFYDSQATELYSFHGYSQMNTHVSQSQFYEQIVTNEKFLRTKTNRIDIEANLEAKTLKNIHQIDKNIRLNNNESNQNINNLSIEDVDKELDSTNILSTSLNQDSMQINESFPQCAQDVNESQIYEVNEVIDMEMQERDTTAIVSFKVIEELNKVKNYINRRVERRISNDGSIDSGYKSDSQKSSFRSSFQPSGNSLNQSAHTLYEYLARCPLLPTAQEIVNEIAQVLGQLIDKLHEEEKYPSFLENLLENIDLLIQEVLHGSGGEDTLLTKDEQMQRIFLLTKSKHMQKYTLDKIVKILEDIQTQLADQENSLEITHTTEIENLSYIFHLLETTLRNHTKGKYTDNTQEVHSSQNELRKTSIVDIWRRKWNPNYREEFVEEVSTEKCVLTRCNEVLNKLVVCCMGGYSLIAYSALQCFNILQN